MPTEGHWPTLLRDSMQNILHSWTLSVSWPIHKSLKLFSQAASLLKGRLPITASLLTSSQSAYPRKRKHSLLCPDCNFSPLSLKIGYINPIFAYSHIPIYKSALNVLIRPSNKGLQATPIKPTQAFKPQTKPGITAQSALRPIFPRKGEPVLSYGN